MYFDYKGISCFCFGLCVHKYIIKNLLNLDLEIKKITFKNKK